MNAKICSQSVSTLRNKETISLNNNVIFYRLKFSGSINLLIGNQSCVCLVRGEIRELGWSTASRIQDYAASDIGP